MKKKKMLKRIEALELAVLGKTQATKSWPECDLGKKARITTEILHNFPLGSEVELIDSDDRVDLICAKGLTKSGTPVKQWLFRSDYELIEEARTEPEQWVPEVGDWVVLVNDEALGFVSDLNKGDVRKITKIDEDNIWLHGAVSIGLNNARFKKSTAPAGQTTPEIIPAECLREMPKSGTIIYARVDGEVELMKADQLPKHFAEGGRCFADTPEGKAGALRRASEGIVPYPVTPAKALTEPLEVGDKYWLVDSSGTIAKYTWHDENGDKEYLSQGRIFPDNLRGKLGAALYQPSNSEL